MSILVTGGAGYIGSHCLHQLRQQDRPVVVLDDMSNGHKPLLQNADWVQGSTLDRDLLVDIFKTRQITAVMHFAAFAYVGESCQNPEKYYNNNVVGTLNLLSAMREAGVKYLIFSSTCATYGIPESVPITENTPQKPVSPYGMTKLAVEFMLADFATAYDLNYLAFRYFNASGADPSGLIGEWHEPETHLIPLALQALSGHTPALTVFGTDYPTPDGTCIRDYIHVNDIAKAHIMGLDYLLAGGSSTDLNIGIGRGYSVKEVLASCERITGKPVPYTTGSRRDGDPPALVANAEKIRTVLGWTPDYIDLDAIIQTAWQWEQTRQSLYNVSEISH